MGFDAVPLLHDDNAVGIALALQEAIRPVACGRLHRRDKALKNAFQFRAASFQGLKLVDPGDRHGAIRNRNRFIRRAAARAQAIHNAAAAGEAGKARAHKQCL